VTSFDLVWYVVGKRKVCKWMILGWSKHPEIFRYLSYPLRELCSSEIFVFAIDLTLATFCLQKKPFRDVTGQVTDVDISADMRLTATKKVFLKSASATLSAMSILPQSIFHV